MSSTNGLRVWRHREFADFKFDVPEYFVDQILAPRATSLIVGAREAGKTQFLLTLIRAMQEEALFLGRFQARKGKVAFFELDMPDVAFQTRLQRAITECEFAPDLVRFVVGDGAAKDMLQLTPKQQKTFEEVREWGPDVVLFDSLRKCHTGNENDPSVPSLLYSKWRDLFPGAGFGAIHHVWKQPSTFEQGKKGNIKFDPANEPENYRGTTAWLDDADFGVTVAYNKGRKRRTVRIQRGRTLTEEMKEQLISVTLDGNGLFLKPAELTPVERLTEWHMQHPTKTKTEAVDWIAAEYKGHGKTTYYRWAQEAGYTKG